jgi:predicted TIM-barrel fold metal-dependent hydrolase
MADFHVIDADGHVNEVGPVSVDWGYYLEAPYRDRVKATGVGPEDVGLFIDGAPFPRIPAGERRFRHWAAASAAHNERPGMWDPKVRIAHMDEDGIAIAVLYGTSICEINSELDDAGLAATISRAYNNWLHDFCAHAPDRLKGVASVPLQDMEETVRELERAVTKLGFVGVGILPDSNLKTLMDPYFFPLYEALQALDVPLGLHLLGGGRRPMGGDRYNHLFFTHTFGHPFEQMLAMQALVAGGVLDRFPRLRVAFLEGDCGWLPWWLHRMDSHYEKLGEFVPSKAKPSEYLVEGAQCFIGCEGDEPMIPYVAGVVGADRLVFASDYWHWDGEFPGAVAGMTGRADLPDSLKRKVLGENAARLYRLK